MTIKLLNNNKLSNIIKNKYCTSWRTSLKEFCEVGILESRAC